MSFAYDQVFYPALPFAQTHPDRLCTLARLFGLTAAHPERCRVLEIGSSDGGNLIPMALALPESEFTGIDLAERPVERGCAMVRALGLKNIRLQQMDLMQAGAEMGEFDYIIAHGVYSWVPPEVRDHLLSICRGNLALRGVAYISYNCYPGFHRREMFREMMLHHVRDTQEPEIRFREAVGLIRTLADCRPETELARALFDEQLRHLATSEPSCLYHDDLANTNYAPHFHEFLEHGRQYKLAYLGEADFFEMRDDAYPEPVSDTLRRFAEMDVVLKEQYLDFMKGRRFRQTLLCREEVVLDRQIRPERITEFYLASAARPGSSEASPESLEEFRGPRGAALKTDYEPAKAALRRLGEIWPQALQFSGLLALAGGDAAPLAEILFRGFCVGLVEAHTLPPQFAHRVGDRPAASPLARLQAQRGIPITTLRHTAVQLEDIVDRCVLLLLDGTRNRDGLMAGVRELLRSHAPGTAENITAESLEERLERLAKQALLMA